MSMEMEDKIMARIGLGQHYSWSNGSGSCEYIRRNAVEKLPDALEEHGLEITPAWLAHCRKAIRADSVSRYRLTNTWIACSYAIQDAIYRAADGNGISPVEDWHFRDDKERQAWEQRENPEARFRQSSI